MRMMAIGGLALGFVMHATCAACAGEMSVDEVRAAAEAQIWHSDQWFAPVDRANEPESHWHSPYIPCTSRLECVRIARDCATANGAGQWRPCAADWIGRERSRTLSRQISIGDFHRRISPTALTIHEQ